MAQTTASVYDPSQGGINGSPNSTPCGPPVREIPWSVAHKTLPCGTVIVVKHGSRSVAVPVGDRGPYVAGRDLDLRPQVAAALGVNGLGTVTYSLRGDKVDMAKFAKAGGTQMALAQVAPKSQGKGGFDPLAPVSPFNNSIGDLPNPLKGIEAVGQFFNELGNNLWGSNSQHFWLRVGRVTLGVAFGLMALAMMGHLTQISEGAAKVLPKF